MFQKVLVATRGEIAVRIIRACREMGIQTVAIYSQADREALHVKMADQSVCVGPPASQDSYLNMPNIISAAVLTGAEAIHPGIGFLAENPSFAEACLAYGIKFIGPSPEVMDLMGDKAAAREKMKSLGLPPIPGTQGTVSTDQEALKVAQKLGYPVMIKAAAGGGGKGIRIVHSEAELQTSFATAQREARSAFGNPAVYLEKCIKNPRHIEVQIIADEYGNVCHLGERECSIQSRYQKLIEEAPSPSLCSDLRKEICRLAVKAAREIGYANAGTMEFLVDEENNFYFMEMNTRLQVEHPVTEMITGLDLVKLQIMIAAREKLPFTQENISVRGHAIECRVNAMDPDRNFAPTMSRLDTVILPGGPGVRVDTHIYPGYEVPPYYDALLAKVITWGQNREEALLRMRRSLLELQLGNVKTTIPFLLQVMDHPEFRAGQVTTSFLSRFRFSSG